MKSVWLPKGKHQDSCGLNSDSLHGTHKPQATKAKIYPRDPIKLKALYKQRKQQSKRTSYRTQYLETIHLLRAISKVPENKQADVLNGQRSWRDISQKKKYKWPTSTWSHGSTISIIWEIQINTRMRSLLPVILVIIQKWISKRKRDRLQVRWRCTVGRELS